LLWVALKPYIPEAFNPYCWLSARSILFETTAHVFKTVISLRCGYEEYRCQNLSSGYGTVWCC
jgi:hypothetical protein